MAREFLGEMILKFGAEGVICAARRGQDAAFALKVLDGNARALLPALIHLLFACGWLHPRRHASLRDLEEPELLDRSPAGADTLWIAMARARSA